MGKAKIAEYKKQKLAIYQDNILIEALPDIKSRIELLEEMTYYPEIDEDEIDLSDEERLLAVNKIYDVFHPFKMHADFAEKVTGMIRDGYVSRKPARTLKEAEKINHSKFRGIKNAAFIGPSGVGKSTSTERVLSLFDQVIVHTRPHNLYQIVWLKVDCPPGGSLKQLCLSFFKAIDDIEDMGTDYARMYQKYTLDRMTTKVAEVATRHHLGLLVIDEIQNLTIAKSVNEETMLNFFVTLNNTSKIPVMLIGTPKAKGIFKGDFRHMRRWGNEIKWGRLDNDGFWKEFLIELWDYNWLKKNQPELTQELVNVFYEESQGIIDVVLTLYKAAQERGVRDGLETFNSKTIKLLAKTELAGLAEVLDALKLKDKATLSKFSDITLETMSDFTADFSEQKPDHKPSKSKISKQNLAQESIEQLVMLDVSENYAKAHVEDLIKKRIRK